MKKIGFGGGCHWCTEGVFQSLKGVHQVKQGWIASTGEEHHYSEGVIVYFDDRVISLKTLITIHLHTHSSTSNHTKRKKYRSAIYTFTDRQVDIATKTITSVQDEYDQTIITKVIPYDRFKLNDEKFLNYYHKNSEKPFCQTYITPKIKELAEKFPSYTSHNTFQPHLFSNND